MILSSQIHQKISRKIMKAKIVGYYSIFIGISVMVMWTLILLTGQPPEGKTELSFHVFSEFLMALLCLGSGILLLKKGRPVNCSMFLD